MKDSELGKRFKDGEVICHEGEEGKSMFVIQSGKVNVVKHVPDGELLLTSLKAGEIFGEMSLFDKMPRSATVKSVGDTVILKVDKKGFFAKASKDPSLAFNILQAMSKRIRSLNQELTRFKKSRDEILGSYVDIQKTGARVLEEIKNSIKADNGSVMLLDNSKQVLRIISAFGAEADTKAELKVGVGIAGDVIKTGKIELINNISSDPRFTPGQMKFETLLCAPLKTGGHIFGVINLSNNNGNFFNLDDLKLLKVLSVYASISLENAKLYTSTEKLTNSIIKHATLLEM